jgi:hypothetical protein
MASQHLEFQFTVSSRSISSAFQNGVELSENVIRFGMLPVPGNAAIIGNVPRFRLSQLQLDRLHFGDEADGILA